MPGWPEARLTCERGNDCMRKLTREDGASPDVVADITDADAATGEDGGPPGLAADSDSPDQPRSADLPG